MKKWLVLLILFSISCLDFELQSPYEDLNGIVLEHIGTYDAIQGRKLQLNNSRGYVCSWWGDTLSCYDFSDAYAISPISSYCSLLIIDFTVKDNYTYVGIADGPYFDLEIVDFNQPQPIRIGLIGISHFPSIVKLRGSHAYVAGDYYISVVDVHDKTSPEVLTVHYFDDLIVGLEVDSNYAYVLFYHNNFQILDISEPSQIHTVWSTSLLDTTAVTIPDFFALDGRYIYVAITKLGIGYMINVYHITDSPRLEYVSTLEMPAEIRNLFTKDTTGLALLNNGNTYLLNLKYPTLPCVNEILQESAWYGIMKDSYIYLLTPRLKVFEIKEVEQ